MARSTVTLILPQAQGVASMRPVLAGMMVRRRRGGSVTFAPIDAETAEKMRRAKESAAADPQNWLEENEELVRQYAAFKQSAAYRASPAGKIEDYLRAFCQESGYNDVFIPALRRLSPAYDAYYRQLAAANGIFSHALEKINQEGSP